MTFKYMCCDDGSGSPVGTMVQFENVTILIDPSWDAANITYEDAVKYWSTIVPEIDLIILSDPTTESLGAYALLYYNFLSHFLSRIEVFATLPIANLGRVSTIDYYVSRGVVGPYTSNVMDVDDIEKAFDFIKTLKYSQIVDLKFKFDGLSLVAFNSGSSPGGSLWCISTYVEKLVYAKRWNHTKGTLLNGANLLDNSGKPISALMRPSAVITTFDKFGLSRPFKRRNREFKDTIKEYVNQKKSIIIPVEISNKFLELFAILHDLIYSSKKMGHPLNVPILLISYSRGRSLTYAKSMLEWLTASLLKIWSARDNESPFSMGKNFHIIGIDELSKFSGPKICLVSDVDTLLNEVVNKLHATEKLNIILTQSTTNANSNQNSLLSQFYKKWNDISNQEKTLNEGDNISFNESIKITNWKYEYLKDDDLKEFTSKINERRELNKKKEETLKQQLKDGTESFKRLNGDENGLNGSNSIVNGAVGEEGEEEDDDDEDDIFLNKNRQETNNEKIEIPVDIHIHEKTKYKMFPFNPKREKPDDYGGLVDFTQFIPKDDDDMEVDAEEGEEGNTVGGDKKKSKKNRKKRIQSDSDGEDNEDNDEYVISDIPVKKSRRGRSRKDSKGQEEIENFDNMDYLDALNRPCKRTMDQIQVRLKVSLTHFNLDNIVDQRSATVIWPLLKSRKMILLGPSDAQNESVISNLSKKNTDILKTTFNEKVIMDTAIKTLEISIDTELDQLLNWQKIGDDHTVAQVVGRLVKEITKDTGKEQNRTRGKLVLKPLEKPTIFNSSGTLSIGDVRLAELKRKLTEQNHVAEFKGEGMLVIDDQVAVRKINDGETIIDGTPSELFDTVKTLVTDMLAKI